MSCGASVGRNYGPVVVTTRDDLDFEQFGRLHDRGARRVHNFLDAVPDIRPGRFHSAFPRFRRCGGRREVGQGGGRDIAARGTGFCSNSGASGRCLNLGKKWFDETGLPIPLGLDVVNRSLGDEMCQQVTDALKSSIEYAHANEDAALDYALGYGRGIEREYGRRFVRMYVNSDTLDMGEEGRRGASTAIRDGGAPGNYRPSPAVGRASIELKQEQFRFN